MMRFVRHMGNLSFFVFVLGVFFALATPNVLAAGNEEDCQAIDVVVLLDQSGSMYDSNDRDGGRFLAARSLINYLGNHAVWYCFDADVQHRIAIVGFGDKSTVIGPDNDYKDDTRIFIGPIVIPQVAQFEAWRNERLSYREELDQYKSIDFILGATDHKAAIQKAVDILNNWKGEELGNVPRSKAIILITDGGPCTKSGGCFVEDSQWSNPVYMRDLMNYLSPGGNNVPWRGSDNADNISIRLFMIALRDEERGTAYLSDLGANRNTLQENWESITRNHGGDFFIANENNSNMSVITSEILGPVIGNPVAPLDCQQSLWIEPYADNLVVLYAFSLRSEEDLDVDSRIAIHIFPKDGNEIVIAGGDVTKGNANLVEITDYLPDERNEFYTFVNPLPGRYQIDTVAADSCKDLEIRINRAPVTAAVETPNNLTFFPETVNAPYYDVNNGFAKKIRFQLTSRDGTPLQEFSDYPLDINAVIVNDDEREQIFNPEDFEFIGNGFYESKKFIEAPKAGRYNWKISASVRHPNPEEKDIFIFSDAGYFTVAKVDMFTFSIEEPVEAVTVDINTVEQGGGQVPVSIPVAVRFSTIEDGTKVNVGSIIENPNAIFTAILYNRENKPIEEIPLLLKSGQDTLFVGKFKNEDENGEILEEGEYRIAVQADWQGNYNPSIYAPFTDIDTVTFKQQEIFPIDLKFISPNEDLNSFHKSWHGCFWGQVDFFDISAQIFNINDPDEPLRFTDVLLNNQQDEYKITVFDHDNFEESVVLQLNSNNELQKLEGGGGSLLKTPGNHKILLDLDDQIQLNRRYVWVQPQTEYKFTREDRSFVTKPAACRGTVGAMSLFSMVTVAWLAFIFSGGPKGYLIVKNADGDEVITLKLSKRRRKNKFNKKQLKRIGVNKVIVKRESSLDTDFKDDPSISVSIKYDDGFSDDGISLSNDESYPIADDGDEITYQVG